jgi:hypothetical protein
MKIDILSDLHFDNYFYGKYTKDDVIKFYSQIIDFNNCGVKFQIMFPLVSHLCFHFFKQVSRV